MNDQSRVLVVDDEIGICEGVKRALEPNGILVDIALDGPAGLDAFKEHEYDLVLLDIKMPKISGLDLIKMVHEIDPEIICIIITGYATVETAISAIKRGAYDFLTKPFSLEVLLLAVNQGLERRKLSLESKRIVQVEMEAQRLAEEKIHLEKLDQEKKQFIRLVTHELKAPISAVENYLKLILQGYVDPDGQNEILEQCVTRTQEERKLIDDLLELGHLEVKGSESCDTVCFREVLEQVLDEFAEEIRQKELDVVLDLEEEISKINAVPEQIKSVWSNLISNAIKYSHVKGRIKIVLRVQENKIIGWVQDDGIGISAEDQKNLFREFFRAKNAKREGIPGTGLGLVLVKQIIEGLGGTISVESEEEMGSIFKFIIPLINEE